MAVAAWRILFAYIGGPVTYCPECADREFGEGREDDHRRRR
jgi:hypothetical protein